MAGSAIAEGVRLHHIARETSDVERLAAFYAEVLGFERVGAPKFGDFAVAWLRIPRSPLSLHIIERNPESKLPVSPYSAAAAAAAAAAHAVLADPKELPRGHHVSFAVSNYDAFVRTLKERGIETFEKTQPDGRTKQVFFFDPDGNGIEVGNWGDS
ncbi:hypothetical protein ACMD2_12828 [Ananas comosus]|uniref:VOC domain-containing protein n=1 Tax=Ananas comosus TaxID=4615 RepID=A0A199W7E2_ANACO|nr:hypothetical protein ACMD2_12828 [Ananas comosus]